MSLDEGGRSNPPSLQGNLYRPHFVVGDPTVRVRSENERGEDYLGVIFEAGPETVTPQIPIVAPALLIYPDVCYDALKADATFTIREGSKIVGYGKVLRVLPSV